MANIVHSQSNFNTNLSSWLLLSAGLHAALFMAVNGLYSNWGDFEPAKPIIIDVTLEAPSAPAAAAPSPPIPHEAQKPPIPVNKEISLAQKKKALPEQNQPPASTLHESTNATDTSSTGGSAHGSGDGGTASPYYASNPKPPYPEAARRAHKEGTVLLAVRVKADGTVSVVEIAQSSGTSLLDESAQKTVLQWRFIPAKLNGESIPSQVSVPVKFELIE